MTEPDLVLLHRLRTCQTNDVHTRNKALMYYKGVWWSKVNDERRQDLDPLIRQALTTGDWRPLRKQLGDYGNETVQ